MSSIGSRISIEGMAANFGARSTFEPKPRKLPVKDTASKSGPDNTQLDPVQTEASFKTYGSNKRRIAIVVKKTEEKRGPGRPKKVASAAKGKRVNIGVPIDEHLWRRIRALAVRKGKLTGELLDQAISDYLDKHERGDYEQSRCYSERLRQRLIGSARTSRTRREGHGGISLTRCQSLSTRITD